MLFESSPSRASSLAATRALVESTQPVSSRRQALAVGFEQVRQAAVKRTASRLEPFCGQAAPQGLLHALQALDLRSHFADTFRGADMARAREMPGVDLLRTLEGGECFVEEAVPAVDEAEIVEEDIVVGRRSLGRIKFS